jgi:hypothetical protein
MANKRQRPETDKAATPATSGLQSTAMSKSMHDGIAVWCDCCSCEMEPYWAEIASEIGVESSDHED